VLITGANGQLGWELQRTAPRDTEVVAFSHDKLDVSDAAAIRDVVLGNRPDCIVNAAAYTAVDRAEKESDGAFAVNRDGPAALARAAADVGVRLIHVSTDFLFGKAQGRPIRSSDEPSPECVYGASKLAGERAVQEVLGSDALIVRTAWVYSAHGRNFVKTILRLVKERDALSVVDDQVGTPTWAQGLAQALWKALEIDLTGIHHWTDAGVASWYDFAVAIQEEALDLGVVRKELPIIPIPTSEYPTPAKRPSYSVLDKSETWDALGYKAPHWRVALRKMLNEPREHRE
jgi:dTDP-4-dehydrorhamnose reductase